MHLVYKIWLENNGKVFGEGPYDLLKRIERTGSLNQATAEIGMSYSQAWRLIRTLEGRLGFLLLERKVGGPLGGGSVVTPKAYQLMQRYERFREETEVMLQQLYEKHFGDVALDD